VTSAGDFADRTGNAVPTFCVRASLIFEAIMAALQSNNICALLRSTSWLILLRKYYEAFIELLSISSYEPS
jgi:hypothetical protein